MAYLEITLKIEAANRSKAADVYRKFKDEFLNSIPGARSKELLVRGEDVQVLHGFDSLDNARAYTDSKLFKADVVTALTPLLSEAPDVRFYECV